MFQRSKSVRESERKDIFSNTWGGSTKYKSGTSTRPHHGVSYPSSRTATNAEPSARRPVDLNKPLPPLPAEAQVVAGAREAVQAVSASQSPTEPRSSPFSKDSTESTWKKRFALFRRSGQKPTNKALPPLPPSEVPPLATSSETFENAPPRKPTYVDAATQTSPQLLPMHAAELPSEPPRRPSGSKFRRPTISRKGSQMSPLAEETPPSSPKGFWVKMTPHDYFSLPFRREQEMSPNTSRPAARKDERRSSEESSKSGSSIGTYESRYSAPEQREVGKSILRRPSIARASNTDSLIDKSSTSSSETVTRPGHTVLPGRHPATTGSIPGDRPLPIPFTRLPSFSANRYRRRASGDSSRGSVSPLRHSLRLPDSPPESTPSDERPKSPGFFRQPVITPNETEDAILAYIPEHLQGSPLCPRSPKHKSGGSGFCPMHGRNASDGSDPPSEVERGRRSSRFGSPERTPDRASFDGSLDTTFRLLSFGIPRHPANSVDCPAIAAKNGICPYHGRSNVCRPKRGKDYSEESVTRIRLRDY